MKKLFLAMAACAALLLVGCVDREFDLADVSGEVTVGGEELVVPLATVNKIYLGELIEGNDVLTNDDNGVYQITFADGGNFEIDGVEIPPITNLSPKLEPMKFDVATIPTTYAIDDIQQQLELEVPSLQDLVDIETIDIAEQIEIPDWLKPYLSGQAELSDAIASSLPALESSIEEPITSSFNASIEMVEGVSAVDFVRFGSEELPGAEFSIEIDLGGIAGVTKEGTLSVDLRFPEGYYFGSYVDGVYKSFDDAVHNIVKEEIKFQKGDQIISKKIYLERINYYDHPIGADGKLVINDEITCDYDLKITLCGGHFDLIDEGLPKLHVKSKPVYDDIEVVIGDFNLDHVSHEFKHEFTGIPEQVKIKKLAFDQNSKMTLRMAGLDWLVVYDNETKEPFSPYMEIILPSCMHFCKDDHGEVHVDNNIIRASLADLKQGVELTLDYIDCLDSNSIEQPIVDKIVINSTIESIIHMESLKTHKVLVSDLMPDNNPVKVDLGMTNMVFNIDMQRSEVEWGEDEELKLDLNDQMPSLSQEVEIPSMIASIESIEIGKAGEENKPMSIKFELGTQDNKPFPVSELELDVQVNLGTMLRPTQNSLQSGLISVNDKGEKILKINRTWLPNNGKLSEVVEFEALENLPEIVDGKLKIDQKISVDKCTATVRGGQDVNLEAISDVAIEMNITVDDIEARKFRGGVDISVAPEEMVVDLGLPDLGVDIGKLSINPILKLNLEENPTGVPLSANVELKTFDAEGKNLTTISVPNVEINGEGATNIVLSTSKNRGKFKECNFVEVNELSRLLSNGIPSKIAVNLLVTTDKTVPREIDLLRAKQGYNIKYDYDVLIPLELDDVELSYETVIGGMNETFASLAQNANNLKVGDIGLVAEFGTTIPFNINLLAEFVNKDGTTDNVNVTLNVSNNGSIAGWTEEYGNNPRVSKIDFNLHFGDSKSLESLENVDGVRLIFTLSNVKEGVGATLMDTQYLNGNLKLRVRDGLTVDIFDLVGKK